MNAARSRFSSGELREFFEELLQAGIYKRSQGRITRQVTFAAAGGRHGRGRWRLSHRWRAATSRCHFGAVRDGGRCSLLSYRPAAACCWWSGWWICYRVVNLPGFADFLIAVEAEMNKVSWPTRSELFRASLVVLVVIIVVGVLLYGIRLVLAVRLCNVDLGSSADGRGGRQWQSSDASDQAIDVPCDAERPSGAAAASRWLARTEAAAADGGNRQRGWAWTAVGGARPPSAAEPPPAAVEPPTAEPAARPRQHVAETAAPAKRRRQPKPVAPRDAGRQRAAAESAAAASQPAEPAAEPSRRRDGRSGAEPAAAEPNRPRRPKSENMDWYILKVQSNREDSIREGLLRRVAMAGLDRFFGDVIVPTEMVTEFKGGKKRVDQAEAVSRLPGRAHGDQRGHLVPGPRDAGHRRLHRGGSGDMPTPMLPHEVARIVAKQEEKSEKAPKLKIGFNTGDRVKINEGTFENFEGEVDSIDETNGRVTVMINIFGRSTPVELEYWQIETV